MDQKITSQTFIIFYINSSIIMVGFKKIILVCLIILLLFASSNADMPQMSSQEDMVEKFEISHQLFIEQLRKIPVPDNGTFYSVEDTISKGELNLQKKVIKNFPPGLSLEPDDSISNNNESNYPRDVSNDLHTMSEVVLLPIFPTPTEMGYSYYNPTGNDPCYVINAPGTYRLGSGFSTRNESAIVIRSPNVILDGNEQIISGSNNGYGIFIDYLAIKSNLTNFNGISRFELGILSATRSSKSDC